MAFVSRNAISSMIDAAAPPAQLLSGCTTLNDALAGRGTKIIATMGPAVRSPTTLDELLQAGVSCVRLDVSCAESAQWFLDSYAMIQGAIKRNQRLCAVMLDTRGEHEVTVRRGVLGAAASKGPQMPLHIHAEQVLTLLGESSAKWLPEHPELLPVSEPAFVASLSVGDIVYSSRYLGTGMESASTYLEVMRISDDRKQAECRAMTEAVFEGLITISKAVIPAKHVDVDGVGAERRGDVEYPKASCLSSDDRKMIQAFTGRDVDFLALSYTETAEQVLDARRVLDGAGLTECAILAKVETRFGLRNFEAILKVANGIIISRGNIGLTLPIEKVATLQKECIRRANLAGKLALITRIFDSMTDAPRPTRAEATDVANAVLDGVDGFLLGAETVRGHFPVAVVNQVARICAVAEKVFHHQHFFEARMAALDGEATTAATAGLDVRASMASTLVRVADKTGVTLIIVMTKSGRLAQEVAVWRPRVPILALFPPTLRTEEGVRWVLGGRAEARRAMLLRGVLPMLADPHDGLNDDAMLVSALAFAQTAGLVSHSDTVAVSHRLRDDIVISLVNIADIAPPALEAAATTSSIHHMGKAAFDRTPSAYDLQRHQQLHNGK